MRLIQKSIAYAFTANGIQIYFSDDFPYEFLAVRLECKKCGEPWYMNLTECFLCGALSPFLYRCVHCKRYYSITGSSKKCRYCRDNNTLKLVCPNDLCLSNVDPTLINEINDQGGVFDKDSGFRTAQSYCLNCGSQYHIYKTIRIYIANLKDDILSLEDLEYKDTLKENSLIIGRRKDKTKLCYAVIESNLMLSKKKVSIKKYYSDFSKFVDCIF